MNKLQKFSPQILRIGIALVFVWFGWSQIHDAKEWLGFVPQWVSDISHLSVNTIVYLNGIFEILFGTALLFGFFTRFVAFLLGIHMLDITFIVGLNALGVRDFGLAIATLVVWMNGMDDWGLDRYILQGSETNMSSKG